MKTILKPLKNHLIDFYEEETASDLVEYTLLIVLIAAAAVLVLTGLGTSITSVMNKIKTTLDESLANVD